jgi:hypothetical protein
MTVARLVYYVLPEKRVWNIRAGILTRIFVGLDIFSFLVQAAGGSMMSNQGDQTIIQNGQRVYMTGIGVQGLFILAFACLTWTFYLKVANLDRFDRNIKRVRQLIWTLYIVLMLIMVSEVSSII